MLLLLSQLVLPPVLLQLRLLTLLQLKRHAAKHAWRSTVVDCLLPMRHHCHLSHANAPCQNVCTAQAAAQTTATVTATIVAQVPTHGRQQLGPNHMLAEDLGPQTHLSR